MELRFRQKIRSLTVYVRYRYRSTPRAEAPVEVDHAAGNCHRRTRRTLPGASKSATPVDRDSRVLHAGLLIRKHRNKAERMIETVQESCRLRLSSSGFRAPDHPVWARSGWKVFLDHPDDIRPSTSLPSTRFACSGQAGSTTGRFATSVKTRSNAECPRGPGRLCPNMTVGLWARGTTPTRHTQGGCGNADTETAKPDGLLSRKRRRGRRGHWGPVFVLRTTSRRWRPLYYQFGIAGQIVVL